MWCKQYFHQKARDWLDLTLRAAIVFAGFAVLNAVHTAGHKAACRLCWATDAVIEKARAWLDLTFRAAIVLAGFAVLNAIHTAGNKASRRAGRTSNAVLTAWHLAAEL